MRAVDFTAQFQIGPACCVGCVRLGCCSRGNRVDRKISVVQNEYGVFQKQISDFRSAGIFATVSHLLCWSMNWYIFLVKRLVMVPCTRDMEIMPPAKAAMSLAEQVRRSLKAAIVRSIFEMRCSATFMEPFFRFNVMPNQVIS